MKQILVSTPDFLGPIEYMYVTPVENTPRANLIGVCSNGKEVLLSRYQTVEFAQQTLSNCSRVVMAPNVKDAYLDFNPPIANPPKNFYQESPSRNVAAPSKDPNVVSELLKPAPTYVPSQPTPDFSRLDQSRTPIPKTISSGDHKAIMKQLGVEKRLGINQEDKGGSNGRDNSVPEETTI